LHSVLLVKLVSSYLMPSAIAAESRRTLTLPSGHHSDRVHDFDAIRDILKPYNANLMRGYPVSRRLNNSKVDDAESASPVMLDTPTPKRLF